MNEFRESWKNGQEWVMLSFDANHNVFVVTTCDADEVHFISHKSAKGFFDTCVANYKELFPAGR